MFAELILHFCIFFKLVRLSLLGVGLGRLCNFGELNCRVCIFSPSILCGLEKRPSQFLGDTSEIWWSQYRSACLEPLVYLNAAALARWRIFSKNGKRRTLKSKYYWNPFLGKPSFRNAHPRTPPESQPARNWKIFLEKSREKKVSRQSELCRFGFWGGAGVGRFGR